MTKIWSADSPPMASPAGTRNARFSGAALRSAWFTDSRMVRVSQRPNTATRLPPTPASALKSSVLEA